MNTLMRLLAVTPAVMLWICAETGAQEPIGKPAVLLLGQGPELAGWALPRKLTQDGGFVIGGLGFDQLTWEKLRQINAVVLFDLSRLKVVLNSPKHATAEQGRVLKKSG